MVWHDDPNSSRPLLVVTTLFLVWTTLFTGIRVWARWAQQRSLLDVMFVSSYLLAVAQCTTIFLAIARYGFGEVEFDAPSHANSQSWKKSLFASEILYILCMGVSKCATSFFLGRLSRERKQNMIGTTLAAVAAAWTVGSVFAIAIRGDLPSPWLTVGPNWTRWLGIEISGLVLEIAAWAFAVTLIIGLQLPVIKRIRIMLIFGARLLLVALIAYRLVCLSPSVYSGSIHDITMVGIFTQLPMHFALFAECLVSLRPFMQTFSEGLAMEDDSHYWGGLSITTHPHGSNSNGYLHNSNGKKKSIKVSSREVPSWRRTQDDDTKLSRSGFSTKIESSRRAGSPGEDDIELIPQGERNGIWVQQEMNVQTSR